ncbi:hypothetical protein [Staphylococcus phage vB_ScaM-V1SC04]|nr:hypothetical protein [Staphylococcus phage vB_ScaM-V1SC04]
MIFIIFSSLFSNIISACRYQANEYSSSQK